MTKTKPQKAVDMGYTMPDGQRYEQVGTRIYETASGRETTLYRLRTNCPICGEAFESTVSRSVIQKRGVPRRCSEHRMPGLTVAQHHALLTQLREWRRKAADAARAALAIPAEAVAHLPPDRRAAVLGMFD